jgi:hypothetical protein
MRPVPFSSLAAFAWCMLAAPVAAQEPKGVPRVLLDRQLHERAVQLVGLDGRTITYTDAAGLVRNEAVSEYLAIIPPVQSEARPGAAAGSRRAPEPQLAPARAWSVVELADSERFFGDVAPEPAVKESLRWAHPILGTMEFKIDQVRRVRLDMPPAGSWTRPPASTPPDLRDDIVIFANGDRISGFVEGMTGQPRELQLVPDAQSAARAIGLDVVREVVFANPAQALPARSTLVWLRDGSIIACRSVKTTRMGELNLSLAIQDTEAGPAESGARSAGVLRLEDLMGAAFEPGGLVPLCSLPPAVQQPTRAIAIGDADRAVLGAGDIELPGPLNVEWDLPAGAVQFGATAELPRQMWTWGDCQVVVDAGGTEVFRARLNADQPTAGIAVALGGARRLSVRVEPGAYGPVQDRVLLRRPLLLVGKP